MARRILEANAGSMESSESKPNAFAISISLCDRRGRGTCSASRSAWDEPERAPSSAGRCAQDGLQAASPVLRGGLDLLQEPASHPGRHAPPLLPGSDRLD